MANPTDYQEIRRYAGVKLPAPAWILAADLYARFKKGASRTFSCLLAPAQTKEASRELFPDFLANSK